MFRASASGRSFGNAQCALGLTGWVRNDSSGVTLEIQGTDGRVDEFLAGFLDAAPPLSRIDSIEETEIPPTAESTFVIHQSEVQEHASTPVSPDVSICDDCLRELYDAKDRRYRYPFLNCTNCGPRFTIVEDIPYDRPNTTMKSFVMCSQCQHEYDDPSNRRFHAQPNACPDCGPKIWFVSKSGNPLAFEPSLISDELVDHAIESFQSAIAQGQVVAVKGIGGFHLACDATNRQAIATLRERKGRIDKPFAVMVASIDTAAIVRGDQRERKATPREQGTADCAVEKTYHRRLGQHASRRGTGKRFHRRHAALFAPALLAGRELHRHW